MTMIVGERCTPLNPRLFEVYRQGSFYKIISEVVSTQILIIFYFIYFKSSYYGG